MSMPSRKTAPSMTIRLGTTITPMACAWLGRISEALSVTMNTRAGPGARAATAAPDERGQIPDGEKSPMIPPCPTRPTRDPVVKARHSADGRQPHRILQTTTPLMLGEIIHRPPEFTVPIPKYRTHLVPASARAGPPE